MIPIVVLNWNGLEDTVACVQSVLAMRDVTFQVHVIDNGSDGDDYQQLKAQFANDQVEVSRNEQNLGFTRGMNRAVERILANQDCQFIALLNNDTVVAENWLAQLCKAMLDPSIGIVGSALVHFDKPTILDNAGHDLLTTGEILPRGTGEPLESYACRTTLPGVCAGAALYRASMLNDIGLFDEYFETGYEDAEHGLRALVAGYQVLIEPTAIVRHRMSQSVDKIRDLDYAIKLQKNINYTMTKLLPSATLWSSLPAVLTKQLLLLIAPLIIFRWRLAKVQWLAFFQSVAELGEWKKARRAAQPLRKISARELAQYRRPFLPVYTRYFKRYVIDRKKTVFER